MDGGNAEHGIPRLRQHSVDVSVEYGCRCEGTECGSARGGVGSKDVGLGTRYTGDGAGTLSSTSGRLGPLGLLHISRLRLGRSCGAPAQVEGERIPVVTSGDMTVERRR